MTSWGSISDLQRSEESARREADKKFARTMSAWDEGYDLGMRRAAYWDRVAAFGAIRRAAEVARENDCHCGGCPISHRAKLIRRAIRAAIGSPKA